MGEIKKTDIVLIGAGIMSATLASLIKELEPNWKITVFEQLDKAGQESSNEWNNAGTGHSALCEMNYTVEKSDGSMDITKAVNIYEQFQLSRQFWAYLVQKGLLQDPHQFIMPLSHISLAQGAQQVEFLKKRYAAMTANSLFEGMEYTEDKAVLNEWFPLIMQGRTNPEPIAATKMATGTDVNFGALSRMMFGYLEKNAIDVHYQSQVRDVKRAAGEGWNVSVYHKQTSKTETYQAKFVFIGAGGGSLQILQKTGIPEAKGIGGFPVSGLFMVCKNEAVVAQHHAKVYGKAKLGAPPMSVPHLDTRYIEGKQSLLFGPFAGFSPKFLKNGSCFDLIASVKPHNLTNMMAAGWKELGLVKYLLQQLMLSDKQRLRDLQEFIPNARLEDWEIVIAGQRVQVIEETKSKGKGTLQFGTKIVTSADGTMSALLGASPGASTAVDAMLKLLEKCFPDRKEKWLPKIKEMIPTYGITLQNDPQLLKQIQAETAKILGIG